MPCCPPPPVQDSVSSRVFRRGELETRRLEVREQQNRKNRLRCKKKKRPVVGAMKDDDNVRAVLELPTAASCASAVYERSPKHGEERWIGRWLTHLIAIRMGWRVDRCRFRMRSFTISSPQQSEVKCAICDRDSRYGCRTIVARRPVASCLPPSGLRSPSAAFIRSEMQRKPPRMGGAPNVWRNQLDRENEIETTAEQVEGIDGISSALR